MGGPRKEKFEALESERAELEESQIRLKAELDAEESPEFAIDAHVKSLALFDSFIAEHADEPERVKSIITRFVDYGVWQAGQKGEGQLEVSLFAHPIALSPESIEYDNAHASGRCFVPESEMVGREGFAGTRRAIRARLRPAGRSLSLASGSLSTPDSEGVPLAPFESVKSD